MKNQIGLVVWKLATLALLVGFNPLTMWSQVGTAAVTPPSTAKWETIRQSKHLTVRVNPAADFSLYRSVTVGEVSYTGPAKKLNSRDSGRVVSLLRTSLTKDLAGVEVQQHSAATDSLIVKADITSVKRSHPWINLVAIAAVFVPVDLGAARVTAWVVDEQTKQVVAEMDLAGSGQMYQVLGSLQSLGQSKIVLQHESHTIAKEVGRMCSDRQTAKPAPVVVASNE